MSYRVLTAKRLPSAPDHVLDGRYEPLAGRIPRAGRAWLATIDQGLALRPEDRPQTVTAWRAAMVKADNPKLGQGISLPFDEEAYERAEPHFRDAWEHAQAAGESLGSFVEAMREFLVDKAGWDTESAKRMLRHFLVTERDRSKKGDSTTSSESGRAGDLRSRERASEAKRKVLDMEGRYATAINRG